MLKVCRTLTVASAALLAGTALANAQGWRWRDDGFVEQRPTFDNSRREWGREQRGSWWDAPSAPRTYSPQPERQSPRAGSNEIRDGGDRPAITPVAPTVVVFPHPYPANTIVIETESRRLYYVLPNARAYEYTISVGREGFGWKGTEVVSRKQAWPDWHPPAEMRQRDPKLPEKMTGGLNNPLGAMALYLGTTLYRIHGTNDERSLGQAQSSGCFRMLNSSVLHLASVTEVGTSVVVIDTLPYQRLSRAERPLPQRPIDPRAYNTEPLRAPPPSNAPPPWRRDYEQNRDYRSPPYDRYAPYGWR